MKLTSDDGVTLDHTWLKARTREPAASVLLVHGITATKDEGGMYRSLAESLSKEGFATLRFSFRGHGNSSGTQRGVTVSGEVLDLLAAAEALVREEPKKPLVVVASSFGAVATGFALPRLTVAFGLSALALWNPVLDVPGTFVEANMPWGRENFTTQTESEITANGYMKLDGTFEVGYVLAREMRSADPRPAYRDCALPALIVHGDQDASVSCDESRRLAEEMSDCRLVTIEGSDHGFDGPGNEDRAIHSTVTWLSNIFSS